MQAAQPLSQILAHLGVERAERLVEQQHLGVDGQRTRERHTLTLSAGQLRGKTLLEDRESDDVEQFVDLGVDVLLGALTDLESERDVVAHRQVLERRVVLEHETDVALLRRRTGDIVTVDDDGPRIEVVETCDRAQERRLTAAGRTQQ